MAATAPSKEEAKEFFDSPEELEAKLDTVSRRTSPGVVSAWTDRREA